MCICAYVYMHIMYIWIVHQCNVYNKLDIINIIHYPLSCIRRSWYGVYHQSLHQKYKTTDPLPVNPLLRYPLTKYSATRDYYQHIKRITKVSRNNPHLRNIWSTIRIIQLVSTVSNQPLDKPIKNLRF